MSGGAGNARRSALVRTLVASASKLDVSTPAAAISGAIVVSKMSACRHRVPFGLPVVPPV
jgi:hypothetical protein